MMKLGRSFTGESSETQCTGFQAQRIAIPVDIAGLFSFGVMRYFPPAGRVVPGNYSQGRAIGQDRVLWVQFPRQQFHSAPGIFTDAARSQGRLVHIAAERLLLVSALA